MGSRARRPLLALLASLAVLALPRPASAAQAIKLAVPDLHAPPNLAGIAAKLAQDVVDAASREPNTTVLAPFDVEKALGAEPLKNLQACGGRAACVAQWAGSLGADRIVVGSLDRSENSYLVKLFLVDLRSKSVLSSVDRSILIASRRLQSDVAAALPGLLEGKAEAKGKLAVTTTAPNATLFFDGEIVGKTPLTLEAKPGKHTVKVEKDGFLPVERFVTVEEGATEQVSLALIAIPGAKQASEEIPAVAQPAAPAEAASGGSPIPVLTWVAGGVAVAAAGLGVGLAVDTRGKQNDAGDGPVYTITRQQALAGKRNAILTNVCWGVAAAGAATAVLAAVLWPKDEPAAAPAPQAGLAPLLGGAALTLSGSF